MLQTILKLQPRSVGVGADGDPGSSNEAVVAMIASDILAQLPPLLDLTDADAALFREDANGRINSLSTVLSHEVALFNRLLRVVKGSLVELGRAVDGEVVMSDALEKMFGSLLDNTVPEIWEEVAYPSLKPLASWVRDLVRRVDKLHAWLTQGSPACFWISGLFFPQGFLTGVLQNHARKYGIAVDNLGFAFNVLEADHAKIDRPPPDGVYIYGLFLDGASWDRKGRMLRESEPRKIFTEVRLSLCVILGELCVILGDCV